MFSAPIHTLEQRAAFIAQLARRSGDVSHDAGMLSTPLAQRRPTSVRVRAGRVVERITAVSVPTASPEVETVDFDLAALATAVAERLHGSEIVITQDQVERYECSLRIARPRSRRDLYVRTRAIFLTDMEQVAMFNRVFAEVFGAPAGADRYRENQFARVPTHA